MGDVRHVMWRGGARAHSGRGARATHPPLPRPRPPAAGVAAHTCCAHACLAPRSAAQLPKCSPAPGRAALHASCYTPALRMRPRSRAEGGTRRGAWQAATQCAVWAAGPQSSRSTHCAAEKASCSACAGVALQCMCVRGVEGTSSMGAAVERLLQPARRRWVGAGGGSRRLPDCEGWEVADYQLVKGSWRWSTGGPAG